MFSRVTLIALAFIVCGCASHRQKRVSELQEAAPAQNEDSAKPYPSLSGTTWEGTTLEGKQCKITFQKEGHSGPGFTYTCGTQKISGAGFFFRGAPVYNNRSRETKYPFAIEFITNYARYRGDIIDDQIVFDEVEPRVIAIDYKRLLGEAYKGRKSITELIDCAGQTVGAFVVFDIDPDYARKNLEHTITFELDDRESVRSGPKNLGEASYYKWVDYPDCVPELYFIRYNLYFNFPAGHVIVANQEVKKRIFEILFKIDNAVKNEDPSVTIIHMPKTLKKTQT